MSSNLIEQCFNLENIEHFELPDCYTTLSIPIDAELVIVDPYMVNMKDLLHIKPGSTRIVRLKRPAWGLGMNNKYIHIVKRRLI